MSGVDRSGQPPFDPGAADVNHEGTVLVPRPENTNALFQSVQQRKAARGPSSGDRIGRFRLLRQLGSGGMGVVYLAVDEELDREVALKSLTPSALRGVDPIAALEAEAKHLASLKHPNIGTIYRLLRDGNTAHLVLEYIQGVTLAERLRHARCSLEEAIRIALQVASAIQYAHSQGVTHGDLKPGNIMVDATGKATVLDFGISFGAHRGSPFVDPEGGAAVAGTPGYMSPEQLRGGSPDPRWDIWSFGCVLFELVSAHPAFARHPARDAARDLPGSPPLQLLPPQIPRALRELITSCLAPKIDDRPRSMAAVHEELVRIHDSSGEGTGPAVVACHLLEARVPLDDLVPFRVWFRNPSAAEGPLEVRIQETVEFWKVSPGSPRGPWVIPPGETTGALIHLLPEREGTLGLPGLSVASRGPLPPETVLPTPNSVFIKSADHPGLQDLGRIFDELNLLPGVGSLVSGTWTILRGSNGSGRGSARAVLAHRLKVAGYRVVRGSGSISGRVERKLLRDIARSLLGILESKHLPASLRPLVQERLEEVFGRGAAETRYFLDLLTERGPRESDASWEFVCWTRLLFGVAREAPIAIVIDHLSAADPETLSLVRDLLRRCHEVDLPVIAVASTGAREVGPIDALTAAGDTQGLSPKFIIDMPRLAEPQVMGILQTLYPHTNIKDFHPTLPGAILERSGGKIDTTLELCRALADKKGGGPLFVASDAGTFQVLPDRDPEPILDAVVRGGASAQQILSAVPEDYREVLEYASLIGREFPTAPLLRLIRDDERVDHALDWLETIGWIHAMDAGLEQYRFEDPHLADTVRGGIAAVGRRAAAKTARTIAAELRSLYDDQPELAEWLGATLVDLGEERRGVELLLDVLREHVNAARWESANAILRRILPVIGYLDPSDVDRSFRWHLDRARVLLARDNVEAAREASSEALELATKSGDPEKRVRALLLAAQLDSNAREFERVEEAHLEIEGLCEANQLGALTLDARINRAVLAVWRKRPEQALRLLERNLKDSTPEDAPIVQARTRINLGSALHHMGRSGEAREQFRIAHQLARTQNQLELETQAHVWLCNLDFAEGRFEDARRGYQLALERFQTIQNRKALGRAYFNLAQSERMLGRFDVALGRLHQAIDVSRRSGFPADEQQFRVEVARVAHECGNDRLAVDALEGARSLARRQGAPLDLYQLDAYAVEFDPSFRPLAEAALLRALERWPLAREADAEPAARMVIGYLDSSDPATEIPPRTSDLMRDLIDRLGVSNDVLPVRLRVLAAFARHRRLREGLAGLIDALESRVRLGPPGLGLDWFHCTRASLRDGEARELERRRAREELDRLLGEIRDLTTRESVRQVRLAAQALIDPRTSSPA